MTAELVVTGSTGRVGGRVARIIASQGVQQRLLVRDPARAPDLPGTDVAIASYADGVAVRAGLEGARLVFMVSAAEAPDRVDQHLSFVDAAVAAGVEHLVYTSIAGAASDSVFSLGRDHWATEEHIKASGLAWTFLRDTLYLDFLPEMTGPDGVIRGPAGDGRVSAVAIDDVAAVAAAVLLDPGPHVGATYTLTGPEALSLTEAAEQVTRSTGRTVTFQDESIEEAYAWRAAYDAPGWQVDGWVTTYTSIASGEQSMVTDDVPRITGRPATSLSQLLSAD